MKTGEIPRKRSEAAKHQASPASAFAATRWVALSPGIVLDVPPARPVAKSRRIRANLQPGALIRGTNFSGGEPLFNGPPGLYRIALHLVIRIRRSYRNHSMHF